jgi:hypothetical protein
MGRRVVRYLLLSQLSFFGCLGICLAIFPRFVFERNEVGVSNYGVRAATTVPYTLGFLLCAIFIVKAGHLIPRSPPILGRFRNSLFTLGALLILVLASTYSYKINIVFTDIHILTGGLLISFELVMSLSLTLGLPWSWSNLLLLVVQASGCVLALITLLGVLHLLLLAQLIACGAFGVLLVRLGNQLMHHHPFDELPPVMDSIH